MGESSLGAATTVVTVVHGRHEHLSEQRRVLGAVSPLTPHVVVAIEDAGIDEVVERSGGRGVSVVHVDSDPRGLPLARARNIGVEVALAGGAELVVLLDVDCVPGPQLVTAYERAASWAPGALLAGPVTYLAEETAVPADPSRLDRLTHPHVGRPAPSDGEIERGGDHRLFWSLSAAMSAATWRLLGGFDETYVGYGGEDTDFGRIAQALGVDLVWVGGAHAYHQFHPVSRPPVEHLADIVRNAEIFRRRWHEWPMEGWLEEFESRDLIVRRGDQIELVPKAESGPHERREVPLGRRVGWGS
ncbi:MAG: galactosyltransferase-related protein [Knoellia sp.]